MSQTTPTLDSSIPNRSDERLDLTHQNVNGYRVLHRLGAGGMADVYLAFHEQLQRHVALKVMRADLAASKDHIQRFLQEARSAASLIHPNIVQVYDIGTWDKSHYIAQEYIAGNTLRSYIHRRGSLSQPEALSIMLQTAAALQKAASIGVVHRDIKPDNILLTPDGEVKVADFGLARVRTQNHGLTEIGVALGTPTYMSPEQIQGQAVDARSDLYSLGATAYEMLAGRPPFEGETALALALQHLQNAPPSLQELRPDLDVELFEIISRLLAKNPDDRFGSAADLVRAVKRIAERLSISMSLDHPIPLSGILLDQVPVIGPETTHLQTAALRAERTRGGRSWKQLALPLLLIGSGFAVAGVIRNIGTRPLIRQPTMRTADAVKSESNIEKQFFLALMTNKPAYWRAVEQKFAPNEKDQVNINYNLKAWLHLAWYDLDHDHDNAREAAEAAEKILRYCNDDLVMQILAKVAKGMAALHEKKPDEFQRYFQEAKTQFQKVSPDQRQLIESSMPIAVLDQWNLSDATDPART
jgi:serine/threonine protein kinase